MARRKACRARFGFDGGTDRGIPARHFFRRGDSHGVGIGPRKFGGTIGAPAGERWRRGIPLHLRRAAEWRRELPDTAWRLALEPPEYLRGAFADSSGGSRCV